MFLLDAPVEVAYHLVGSLVPPLGPVLGPAAAAGAIVVFTAAVRLALLPLAVAQARSERSRARLLPETRRLQERHQRDPVRLQKEIAALYAGAGVSRLSGILPLLAQWPIFMIMYRLFVSAYVAGHQNVLLAGTLLGTPLGQNWIGVLATAPLSPHGLVFLGLFALLAVPAWLTSRRVALTAPEGAPGVLLRLVPYGTVVFAAFVPLAAGIYLLVSTTWTAAERALLQRRPGGPIIKMV